MQFIIEVASYTAEAKLTIKTFLADRNEKLHNYFSFL